MSGTRVESGFASGIHSLAAPRGIGNTKKYPFLRVGVTGGIGSGKSTVCGLFSRLGRTVIQADDLAHRVANEDSEVKRAIQREFGPAVYLPDGLLDRKTMAKLVFADEHKRKTLNAIVHPRVFSAIAGQLDSLSFTQYHPYILIEAALVYETGMNTWLDCVIVVTAGEETRIQRVMTRDGASREDVLRRIRAQMPIEEKVERADFVIRNDGLVSELDSSVLFLDRILSHMGATGGL